MAIALVQNQLPTIALSCGVVPGSFTGVYSRNTFQLEKLNHAVSSFVGHLDEIKKQKRIAKTNYQIDARVRNVANNLPLTGELMEEVGPFGLMYARLDLLKYYKKSSTQYY
ncbi:MAG: hypothetical protein HYY52_01365 [Candidatus Melainabacteria bacterium]|nr:hypothetical protein [Candidatus Melainabacteria bacterium]